MIGSSYYSYLTYVHQTATHFRGLGLGCFGLCCRIYGLGVEGFGLQDIELAEICLGFRL